jgi:uncharacterized OsmC-like protein
MTTIRPVKTPSHVTVHVDEHGITAVNDRGTRIQLAPSSVSDGFTPLELVSAALGFCTAITMRSELRHAAEAAARAGFTLEVDGVKATDGPSRLARLDVQLKLPAGVADAPALLERAEAACTIAHTLKQPAEVHARLVESSADV